MLKGIVAILSLLLAFNAKADTRWSKDDIDLFFTNDLFKTAFEDRKDNFVVSPLSVYVDTVLLANGADGETKDELDKILTVLDYQRQRVYRMWGDELDEIIVPDREGNKTDIDVINSTVSKYMEQKKDSIKMTNTITGNDFRQEYENKVRDELFAKINHEPTLKLENEVEFKNEWENPFKDGKTRVEDFASLDGTLDKVDMMHGGNEKVNYYQDDKMQAIMLPYKSGDVMHIFLPREGVDFNEFVQTMDANDLFLRYHPVPVDISIPRFKIEYDNEDMISYYRKWGINKIFDADADLSKLIDVSQPVDKIIHKANIETAEKGTEAQAYTAIMIYDAEGVVIGYADGLMRKDWKMIFNANRPFIFMINNGDFIGAYIKGKRFELERKSDSELDAE